MPPSRSDSPRRTSLAFRPSSVPCQTRPSAGCSSLSHGALAQSVVSKRVQCVFESPRDGEGGALLQLFTAADEVWIRL